MKLTYLLSPLLSITLLCSCSLSTNQIKPEVSVVDLAISNVTLFETSLLFKVRVQNTANSSARFSGASHKFFLNGDYVGSGNTDESFSVPRLGSSVQDVTVHLSNLSLVRRIQPMLQGGNINYRLESTLYPSGNSWLGGINVSNSGTFSPGSWFSAKP